MNVYIWLVKPYSYLEYGGSSRFKRDFLALDLHLLYAYSTKH